MTTAREVVAQAIAASHPNASTVQVGYDYTQADAVLAALREHWTSEATTQRLHLYGHGTPADIRAVIAELFEEVP